ncbi:hypothetical protein CYMTET_10533 [Cymbomonas tetramitiformis]|uniref:Uncharacterized protein n=1 Tax=Cymbomonas tetramitiformis TaxID=36881 RepID=A0AAE0GP61_9CHLO|nr:hypothetical protein CYMTET_10533 [Cymbomonas tetramitiformis]
MEGNVEKSPETLESFVVMVVDNKLSPFIEKISKLETEMAGVRHEIRQLDEKLELVLAPPQVRKTKQVRSDQRHVLVFYKSLLYATLQGAKELAHRYNRLLKETRRHRRSALPLASQLQSL